MRRSRAARVAVATLSAAWNMSPMALSNSAAAAGSDPSAGNPKVAPLEKMKPSRVALYALSAPALCIPVA